MNKRIFTRKVQLTGGSTLIVSLPKEWASRVNLKPGDLVALTVQPDFSLKLMPWGRRDKPFSTSLKLGANTKPGEAIREFIARYLVGYDVIEIEFEDPAHQLKKAIKEAMTRKMIGVEVIEEMANKVVVQCLARPEELSAIKALRRMMNITSHMISDSIASLKSPNEEALQEVIERDEVVDKLYLFIIRQLKAAALGLVMPSDIGLNDLREALGFRIIVKSVERIGDHAKRIARTMLETPQVSKASGLIPLLVDFGKGVHDVFLKTSKALFNYDRKLAHVVIEEAKELSGLEGELVKKIISSSPSPEVAVALRTIGESLKRIAEYSSDIAEITINLAVENPQLYG